jgi:hypothetical protein
MAQDPKESHEVSLEVSKSGHIPGLTRNRRSVIRDMYIGRPDFPKIDAWQEYIEQAQSF